MLKSKRTNLFDIFKPEEISYLLDILAFAFLSKKYFQVNSITKITKKKIEILALKLASKKVWLKYIKK